MSVTEEKPKITPMQLESVFNKKGETPNAEETTPNFNMNGGTGYNPTSSYSNEDPLYFAGFSR